MSHEQPQASFDVRVWALSVYRGKRGSTYTVRWRVGSRRHQDTFATRKLADGFRAQLLTAARDAQPFDMRSGLPRSMAAHDMTWLELACLFTDVKWPRASARHRKSLAEALTTVTLALTTTSPKPSDRAEFRAALMAWAFNPGARGLQPMSDDDLPEHHASRLRWLARNSLAVADLAQPQVLRRALESIGTNLDGRAAAPSTTRRKRSALFSALQLAVEEGHLTAHPMHGLKTARAAPSDVVDRRVVVNPEQARALLKAVSQTHPELEAYFACLYFAALRPSEARHLRATDCSFPDEDGEDGWGTLLLLGSTQAAGKAWTDSGAANEDRELKHRPKKATRAVPASPELVETLRRHLNRFKPGVDGRLFVTRYGPAGVALPAPYAKPLAMGTTYRAWERARRLTFTAAQYESPLAKRPYDLRHAAVSLWLNAGIPATQVAEWAGHSVNVLLRVYASCLHGQEESARRQLGAALAAREPTPPA